MYLLESQANKKKSNIFSICQATWDPSRKKFYALNKADELKCCFDRCNEPLKTCQKFCDTFNDVNNKNTCSTTCVKQKILCEDSCKAYTDWEHNPLVQCVKNGQCFKSNFTFNSDCVKNDRENIIKCCRDACIQSNDYDCDELCDFSANILESMETKTFKRENSLVNEKSGSMKKYILIGVILFILKVLLFFLIVKFILKK